MFALHTLKSGDISKECIRILDGLNGLFSAGQCSRCNAGLSLHRGEYFPPSTPSRGRASRCRPYATHPDPLLLTPRGEQMRRNHHISVDFQCGWQGRLKEAGWKRHGGFNYLLMKLTDNCASCCIIFLYLNLLKRVAVSLLMKLTDNRGFHPQP